MKKTILTLLLALSAGAVGAQNSSNYLQLIVNNPWDFYMDDVYDLEHDMVITNAFTLRVRTVANAARIYMKQNILQYPTNFAPNGSGHLAIDFNNTNSTNYTNMTTGVYVQTSSNQLLFRQPQMSSSLSYRYFNYDLVIIETGYDYFFPGYYTFRGIFTMTQP
jgi:hypothetical protein